MSATMEPIWNLLSRWESSAQAQWRQTRRDGFMLFESIDNVLVELSAGTLDPTYIFCTKTSSHRWNNTCDSR